jgi:hypothetical protein
MLNERFRMLEMQSEEHAKLASMQLTELQVPQHPPPLSFDACACMCSHATTLPAVTTTRWALTGSSAAVCDWRISGPHTGHVLACADILEHVSRSCSLDLVLVRLFVCSSSTNCPSLL